MNNAPAALETAPSETAQLASEVSEADIKNLFGATHNDSHFEAILAEPGNDHLAELTAVYYLRPSFTGGADYPETLPSGHPLHERITTLDLDTVQAPEERQILGVLQAELVGQQDGEERGQDQVTLAAQLVPGIVRKHSPQTASAIMETFNSRVSWRQKEETTEIYADALSAVSECLAEHPGEDESDSFYRLKLAVESSQWGYSYFKDAPESIVSTETAKRSTQLIESLDSKASDILITECGMSAEAAAVTRKLMTEPTTALNLVGQEEPFRRFSSCLENTEVRDLFTEVLPTYELIEESKPATDLQASLVKKVLEKDHDADEDLVGIKRILEKSEMYDAFQALNPEETGGQLVSMMINSVSEKEAANYFTNAQSGLNNAGIKTIKENLNLDSEMDHEIWSAIRRQIVQNGASLGKLLDVMSGNERMQRLLQEPSIALPKFLAVMNAPAGDPELLIKAGSGTIVENYAQASKLTDDRQIEHYSERIRVFPQVLAATSVNPKLAAAYRHFTNEQSSSMSAKQEVRAARTFTAAAIFGVESLDDAKTLEEIEGNIIDNFISQLTGQEKSISSEEHQRLIEHFGSLSPLLTYAQQHMKKEDYRQALAELTLSVADDSYDQWRRGDGSPAALQTMIEAGYLPEKMTVEQYQEWISDGKSDSFEEMVSSAKETAKAIREMVGLASVDIDLLAPGYTLNPERLPDIIATRNGLGRFTGMLHKAMGKGGGETLEAEAVDEIASDLGELESSSEIRNLLGLLQGGTSAREVAKFTHTTRTHLEQLRLLVRIANISAEEVTTDALLSAPDAAGKRKVQNNLSEVLAELEEELPSELRFIPQTVTNLLQAHAAETGTQETFTVEDTIDPKVTLEIGETPQRSCQHYETGSFNEGLIGYFGPEVKIAIVRNEKGGIIARSIMRLMQDEEGNPVLFSEPIYQSVASPKIGQLMSDHVAKKAAAMGVEARGRLAQRAEQTKQLSVRKLKMPATYSDTSGGVQVESMKITA